MIDLAKQRELNIGKDGQDLDLEVQLWDKMVTTSIETLQMQYTFQ